jgi:alkaline phosphatase/alkaline phosphatase D
MNRNDLPRNTMVACLIAFGWAGSVSLADSPYHAQGELSGEVTSSTVFLQTRLTKTAGPALEPEGDISGAQGFVSFEYARSEDFSGSMRTDWRKTVAEQDFISRVQLSDLLPATQYFYRTWSGTSVETAMPGPTRSFKTLPAPSDHTNVSFCMGSCMNYNTFVNGVANGGGPITATEEDRRQGYPSFAAMKKLQPDFFIGTGDIVYYDNPAKGAAQTVAELRRKWHQQFRFPRLIDFFSVTPAYWSKDDHDFRFNDADLSGMKLPTPQTGIEVFREQMPICDFDDQDTPTYRTHRVGKNLQLWFTEGRDYRSPNNMPDGPEKSLWGAQQKQWLMDSLRQSDATWKIIISPTPMVGPDDKSKKDNHVNLGGFRHEADEFFQWANDSGIKNLFIFCGDRHWQYHSIHPSGIEEFGCGALNDENSRRGVAPGSSRGTDPEGLIVQPYTYPEPTGGFLHVEVSSETRSEPATSALTIRFHDDLGKPLYTERKISAIGQ